LQDIDFDVEHGEVVGIIGRNGAGKSTLLKILSRITEPTAGYVDIAGRVGSLLEVGTGFHPELTGRENVYLNGAILGMSRREIGRKFDEIVDFSGVGKFIDTPVKHYSTGMGLRLGFAVAAHLEPDILVIDEVLAVGDSEFQRKCLGKMGEVAGEGRTVLFVSHNLTAVENLCQRAILLNEGKLTFDDDASRTVQHYLMTTAGNYQKETSCYQINRIQLENQDHPGFSLTDVQLLTPNDEPLLTLRTGDPLKVRISYQAQQEFPTPSFSVRIRSYREQELIRLNTLPLSGYEIVRLGSEGYVDFVIESLPLTAGQYYLDVGFALEKKLWIVHLERLVEFQMSPKDVYGGGVGLDNSQGLIVVPHQWTHCVSDQTTHKLEFTQTQARH
jgi:lipopolysaccharide transport system ATP-binding protein